MAHQSLYSEGASVTPRFAGTKRYLTPREAADYRGVGYSTLTIERMRGEGPKFVQWGPNVRYDILELDRWMAAHTATPAPRPADAPKRPRGRPPRVRVDQKPTAVGRVK